MQWETRRHGMIGRLTRREWLGLSLAGAGAGASGWFSQLARASADQPPRGRSCILLWMSGGPSQLDTFDPKPGTSNGGPFQAIETSVPGIRVSEHLPKLAARMNDLAIVRSMKTQEGDHARATHLVRTGYVPGGPILYPALGSLVAKELGRPDGNLPNYVSISPYRLLAPAAYSPGFLGPNYGPLVVGENLGTELAASGDYGGRLRVRNLEPPRGVTRERMEDRQRMRTALEESFATDRPDPPVRGYEAAYAGALRMMSAAAKSAFQLDEESVALRRAYGPSAFGQGCLLARRLVERGVAFVEVTMSGTGPGNALGWDTHANNFQTVAGLSEVLDAGWSALLTDLKERGLLETTTVVWMGEFGRTPQINAERGRDHFPNAWSAVLGGGGIKGGQVIGKTSADGMAIEDRPVNIGAILATLCRALGIDLAAENLSNVGRPIRVVPPDSKPIEELLA